MDLEKLASILKAPFQSLTLISGLILLSGTCTTVSWDSKFQWQTHSPESWLMAIVGIFLLTFSVVWFAISNWWRNKPDEKSKPSRVVEKSGALSVKVGTCTIQVVESRIEKHMTDDDALVVLPCNEYFDAECVQDKRGTLGAAIRHAFQGQVDEFVKLMQTECVDKLGPGVETQKTDLIQAKSYGVGKCILLEKPLGKTLRLALMSTSTQRVDHGLSTQLAFLLQGMHELAKIIANAQIHEITMPILGAGKAGLDPHLALQGILLGIAEKMRYGQGGQRPKRVTIVVYKKDETSAPEIERNFVYKALNAVSSGS